MSFNRTVLTIASVVFIIMLTITALIIKKSYKNKKFPPEIPRCPDFWEPIFSDVDGEQCQYKGKNPPLETGVIAPSMIKTFPSHDTKISRAQKCKWAKSKNGLIWDGIWDGKKGVPGC
tara:strand:- start:475 stop:828 length:354 start_codon:yes stop_codon:yes gene_type:complete